jgi:hypothetical protein
MKTKDQLIIEKQDELIEYLKYLLKNRGFEQIPYNSKLGRLESELEALKQEAKETQCHAIYEKVKEAWAPEINIPLVREKIVELLKKKIQNLIVSDLISPLYWEDFADELIKDLQLTDINTPFLGNSGAVIPKTGYLTHSDKWKV